MPTVSITLLSKPGCHLCDDARGVVTTVIDELSAGPSALDLTFDEISILDDAELTERYFEEIPVVLIGGAVHNIWRIDPARFRRAVTDAADRTDAADKNDAADRNVAAERTDAARTDAEKRE